jgi:hypothetical protein
MLILLAISVLADLEYDDAAPDLPLEADAAPDPAPPDAESEIEANEADLHTAPTPPPVLRRRGLLEVLSYREAIVVCVAVVYLLVYFAGRRVVGSKIASVTRTLLPPFRRHFAVVARGFAPRSNHKFALWVTGRTNYQGALIITSFRRTCDPLGFAWAVAFGEADVLAVEIVMHPPHCPSAMMHVGREKPHFVDRLKLKAHALGQRLTMWTDLGESREPFVAIIKSFVEANPVIVQMIEVSDINNFETRNEGGYVARFEFKIIGEMGDGVVDFCMKLADTFVLLKLPGDVQYRNKKLRDKLIKESEGKKEDEKKLTPEEEAKLQKKRERREEKRMSPKIKMVKG